MRGEAAEGDGAGGEAELAMTLTPKLALMAAAWSVMVSVCGPIAFRMKDRVKVWTPWSALVNV